MMMMMMRMLMMTMMMLMMMLVMMLMMMPIEMYAQVLGKEHLFHAVSFRRLHCCLI